MKPVQIKFDRKKAYFIFFSIFSLILLNSSQTNAQCDPGEVEVSLDITTDDWGYECYWEIVPAGNDCGDGTIASGGNSNVGCDGGGDQAQDPSGYDDNATINEGEWCLTIGEEYTLVYADDWGDGGTNFTINFNGFPLENFFGSGDGNEWTFTANEPPALDLTVTEFELYSYTQFGNKFVEGKFVNNGTETVTSFDLAYEVEGVSSSVNNVTGVEIAPLEAFTFMHSVPWNEWNGGDYSVEVIVSAPNGGADENMGDNTIVKETERGPGTPNIVDEYLESTPEFTVISSSGDQLNNPRDLEFHPQLSRKELWVLNKDTESSGSSTTIYFDAGTDDQTDLWKRDGNAWHFMSLATAIAFGENENFATSPGVYDANHDGGSPFTGPSLWSGDLDVYAEDSGGNGSHLDMLHTSPYSQGIAHEKDNVYWVVDGYSNDIVRYDFADDHGPGNSYHGDALVTRYADFEIAKDPNDHIVSHCVLHKESGMLYIVDHGNQRVMRLDINTGEAGGTPAFGPFEEIVQYEYVINYDYEEIISEGLIEPAGIDVIEDRLIVTDHANGDIIIYDLSTNPLEEIGRVETGNPGIMGVKVGPQGRIWYVNTDDEEVVRVDGVAVGVEEIVQLNELTVYPNPVVNQLNIELEKPIQNPTITIVNSMGQIVYDRSLNQVTSFIALNDLNFVAGMYQIMVSDGNQLFVKSFVKK